MAIDEELGFVVTPWEVRGEVDYGKLIKKFGVEPLTRELLQRIERHAGYLHLYLRRGLFFAHRDLGLWLDSYEKGVKVVLYTGRGPSGRTHIGHLVPWIFTKYLQDAFKATLYFQVTDDEKFLVKQELTMDEVERYSYDNVLDVIAVGFDPERTKMFIDTKYAKTLYRIAVEVAKHVTFSTAKATFGFTESSNIGIIFFPAIQAAPCFLAQYLEGKDAHVLIPCAIDQDPYWRIARDVAPKLGFRKPAGIFSKFVPGLIQGGKMSASIPESSIFMTDTPEEAAKKVWNAFTGGQPTVKEQREKGGNPDICTVYYYFYFLFEEDDKVVEELYQRCRTGDVICGECKRKLAERVAKFLEEHQRRRERAKDLIDKFLVED